MKKKAESRLNTWAELRFSIIGSLLARPPSKGELGKELKKLSQRRYRHPTEDRWVKFGVSTIERWYYKALNDNDPILALGRKVRSDKGNLTAISPQLLAELHVQYKTYPDWSYRLHFDNIRVLAEAKPHLGNAPSYASVVRRMKERGWQKCNSHRRNQTPGQKQAAQRLENREVRGFESEHVNALWHLDFHKGSRIVDVNGRWHTPVALCILDDRARLCCHIQWYLHETAESLNHGLTQAFHKRGLPRSLMTDNGAAMIAHETQNGLSRLGILHETTLPYSPYQNGKQEAFWGQLEGRLIKMLSRVEPLTLEFLNHTSQAWVEMEYNRTLHDGIDQSPLDRYLQGPDVARLSPASDKIQLAFTVQETRMQRKSDGTIQVRGIRFEIPSRFRHLLKLHIRYQSWDLSTIYIVDPNTNNLLAKALPQDKVKNANGFRRALQRTVEPAALQTKADPIPPLLRKIISDYAATGLPPAYIPKEECRKKTD